MLQLLVSLSPEIVQTWVFWVKLDGHCEVIYSLVELFERRKAGASSSVGCNWGWVKFKWLSEVTDGLLILLKSIVGITSFSQGLSFVTSLLYNLAKELDGLLMVTLNVDLNGFLIELHSMLQLILLLIFLRVGSKSGLKPKLPQLCTQVKWHSSA